MSMISDAAYQTRHSPREQNIQTPGNDHTSRHRWMAAILVLVAGLCASMAAQATIPAAERQVLLNMYTNTNGDAWSHHTNWNGGPGTECTWYGITCDGAGGHVTEVDLSFNNLDGSLPSLAGLANLSSFNVFYNQLTGPIPSLTGLANLWFFNVSYNQLAGPIPSLAGLANLSSFTVQSNQLTGQIPSLAGLANLSEFHVYSNQLTGPIPSLAGLANLSEFIVSSNQLSGPMPPVPSPSNLQAGGSMLCSNHLDPVADADWDAATGETPWYQNCTPLPEEIFADGFDP